MPVQTLASPFPSFNFLHDTSVNDMALSQGYESLYILCGLNGAFALMTGDIIANKSAEYVSDTRGP